VGELGQTAIPLHRYAQCRGDFHLRRATITSLLQIDGGGVTVADESPHGTWQRIEAAEIVEHSAPDSMVGKRLEFEVSAAIIPIGGFDQTCDACGFKVFKKNAWWATPVNPPGEQFDLRQMIKDGLFAFARCKCDRRCHERTPFGERLIASRSGSGGASGAERSRAGGSRVKRTLDGEHQERRLGESGRKALRI